jgi:hypothetical protein
VVIYSYSYVGGLATSTEYYYYNPIVWAVVRLISAQSDQTCKGLLDWDVPAVRAPVVPLMDALRSSSVACTVRCTRKRNQTTATGHSKCNSKNMCICKVNGLSMYVHVHVHTTKSHVHVRLLLVVLGLIMARERAKWCCVETYQLPHARQPKFKGCAQCTASIICVLKTEKGVTFVDWIWIAKAFSVPIGELPTTPTN